MKEFTPEVINSLKNNEVFVFGTNPMAKHSGGAAWYASQNFGAIQHCGAIGLVNQSYGIITTTYNDQPIILEFIRDQVKVLYAFATLRPDLKFYVTKIGTGIAGFTIDQIAEIFFSLELQQPTNIILPKEFTYHV